MSRPHAWSSTALKITAVGALVHGAALRTLPAQGLAGALLLLGIGTATLLVVRTVRVAAVDADVAAERARRAEHDEHAVQVHDTLGVVRLLVRGHLSAPPPDPARPDDGPALLIDGLESLRREFSDLDVVVDVRP